MIAALEQEWDMELLVRGRGGVHLSAAGESLLPYLRAVCNAQKELEEQAAHLHGLTRGTLRVGTFASVSIHWLPPIMKLFLQRYPGIHFELLSKWEFAEVEDLIRQGQADCGFLGLPAGESADMMVVDVYCRQGDKLSENWVLIDLPWWLKQQGLDIFERTRSIFPPNV